VITTFGIIGFLLLEHGVTNLVDARLHAKLRALAARGVPPSSSPSKFFRNVSGSGSREKSSMSKLGGDDVESGKEALAAAAAAQCPHTDACCPASSEAKLCGGSGDLSIVNVHGPALAHSHGHQHGSGSNEAEAGGATAGASTSALATLPSAGGENCDVACRHNALAQVLEFGIAMHSFIIGIALGVSRDPAEIKPLLIAITFHQVTEVFGFLVFFVQKIGRISKKDKKLTFLSKTHEHRQCFEGIALGSCLIEAEYGARLYAAMGAFYSLSTASGVALGIGIAASYNPGSRAALGVSGVLDSISAAILIYAALVDLIAADFLTKRFRADRTLQVGGYCALLLGAGLMSLIAIWA
jgi:solute carrier family 39 (zinc transporter), member 1/2/3